MQPDVWGKLWDIATGEEGDPARIELDPYTADEVTLVWPDGSQLGYHWYAGQWCLIEQANLCPGDVAARDSL